MPEIHSRHEEGARGERKGEARMGKQSGAFHNWPMVSPVFLQCQTRTELLLPWEAPTCGVMQEVIIWAWGQTGMD